MYDIWYNIYDTWSMMMIMMMMDDDDGWWWWWWWWWWCQWWCQWWFQWWWWCGWHMKWSSRYSLVHLLPTSSSKSAPSLTIFYDFYVKPSSRYSILSTSPDSFLRFLCEIELAVQCRAPFADLTFQKCTETPSFLRFLCESELSLQSCCTFCQQLSPIEPCTAETETLLGRPRPPLYPKKHRVSRPRVFSSLNSRVPDLLLYLMMMWLPWWCGWQDDWHIYTIYIDMMMWLPCWWESWPWQSSVTRKFPN